MKKFSIKIILSSLVMFFSCKSEDPKIQGRNLYDQHCSSCHIAPNINELPKHVWEDGVLPDMAARMGLRINGYDPYDALSFKEKEAWMKTLMYPPISKISKEDWQLIESYVLSSAPDSLEQNSHGQIGDSLIGFRTHLINFDDSPGSLITFLDFNNDSGEILTADMLGNVVQYNFESKKFDREVLQGSAIVDIDSSQIGTILTRIGILNPSERKEGILELRGNNGIIMDSLHRPVNNLVIDIDNDGIEELFVSEFGHLTGELSMIAKTADSTYKKKSLINQPGLMRTLSRDMDGDGSLDIVALTTQGDESITVLYQENPLQFRKEQILKFSPVWGTSWFELIDFDDDGDMDIITAHGDNADKSIVQKPYHGIRIYINEAGTYTEEYFYPLNGATRVMARDFDRDGDMDLACVSTFPDYKNHPERSFVYLNNENGKFDFAPSTFSKVRDANWFLINAADVDKDGDEDIILSTFSYPFAKVPEDINEHWGQYNIDIVVLENVFSEQ